MPKKVLNLAEARQKKRLKTGWSLSEIERLAAEQRALHKRLAVKEPDEVTSGGDMKKILEEPEDDKDS